jgi:[ribosomal protein S5]-alanine N-acetyltransferase
MRGQRVGLATVGAATSPPVEWRRGLPTLRGRQISLRELRGGDAAKLCALIGTDDVSRFISPPPSTRDDFERFITWAIAKRTAGDAVCFAATLDEAHPIGIFQVRALDASFSTAEWGFAIGKPFWGTGVFEESARLVADFAFDVLGICRLEARAAMLNGRGIGALRKIGAVQECVLRSSFARRGVRLDQALYSIIDVDRTFPSHPSGVVATQRARCSNSRTTSLEIDATI